MTKTGNIQDTGLFIGQNTFEFSLTDSFEAIDNLFETIRQYREYANYDEGNWFNYIQEFFQILGFNIKKVAPRLFFLLDFGMSHPPKALVCIIGVKEGFSQIIPGLEWESYLFYAAKHHQIDWVILTNGIQFKVLNFSENFDQKKFFLCELDEIVRSGKTDSFFTLYKVLSVIGIEKGKGIQTNGEYPKQKPARVLADRHYKRREFWEQLLKAAKERTSLHSNISPGVESWISTGAGKYGLTYAYVVRKNDAQIELYIDNGEQTANKKMFDALFINKDTIENIFGGKLDWQRLNDKRASRICYAIQNYGLSETAHWPELQDLMIDAMIRFERALKPHIIKLKI